MLSRNKKDFFISLMILTRLEIDYYQKGISLQDIDISDENLVKILEENNPLFLIHVYRDKGFSKKALRLLRRFVRKRGRDNFIEQFVLTCIHFKEYDLAQTNLKAHNKFTYPLDKYNIFLDILKNEQTYELKNKGEKYKKVIENLSEEQKILLIDFININKEVYLKSCCSSAKETTSRTGKEYLSVFKYGLNFLRNEKYRSLCDFRKVCSANLETSKSEKHLSCSLPSDFIYSQEDSCSKDVIYPSTLPNSLSKEDFIFKNIYKYDCSNNKEIIVSLINFIKLKYDVNVIFVYLHILNTSCILAECKGNCIEEGYKNLGNILLDKKYLNNLGYNDLKSLYEIYRHDSILDRMYEMNIYMEDEYKEIYFQSPLCDIKKIEGRLHHIFFEKDYDAYVKMKRIKKEDQKANSFIEYVKYSHSGGEALSYQEIIDKYELDMVNSIPNTLNPSFLNEYNDTEISDKINDVTCYSGITPDGRVLSLIDCTPEKKDVSKKKVIVKKENYKSRHNKKRRKLKMRSSDKVEFSDTLIDKENSIISNKTLYDALDPNHNNNLMTFNGIKFTKPVRETLFKEKEAKSYDEIFTTEDFDDDEYDITTKIKKLQEKLDEIKKR